MEQSVVASAHTKRPHSPHTASPPRSVAQKRARVAGSKNLKQHEWALVHQHLVRRTKENKDTTFFIHGIEHTWQNVRRKIIRATSDQIGPLEDSTSLPQLPSHIELRSPPPERVSQSQNDGEEIGLSREPVHQPREAIFTSVMRQTTELSSSDNEDDIESAVNHFLRNLRLGEFVNVFRKTDWHRLRRSSFDFYLPPFGLITASREDNLETFANRLYDPLHSGQRMNHHEILSMLAERGYVSTSHFLETVARKADGKESDLLVWLDYDFKILEFGARALGTAAYLNDFTAVGMFLDGSADINGSVSGPHSNPDCRCQVSVITYAQLPRSEEEGPGSSDEMIAYLLGRGAKSTETNMDLLGLLCCTLRQDYLREDFFFSKVQSIVQQTGGFVDVICESPSILETCVLQSEFEGFLRADRLQVFEYLLDLGARTSVGSPLAALIYMNGPRNLVEKLLTRTTNINAYCNSISLNDRFETFAPRPPPYDMPQSLSALQAAALSGRKEIIDLLLQNGADVNCPARGSGGLTPLQAIASLDRKRLEPVIKLRCVMKLINGGANVNAAPAWNLGLSAIQAAALIGDVMIARVLVAWDADVNAPACRYGGGTALALAARRGHVDMVRFLLKSGAAVPAAGVTVSPFGGTYDDNQQVLDLLQMSAPELIAMYGGNGTPSRDYHEYEAEWADDPSYSSG